MHELYFYFLMIFFCIALGRGGGGRGLGGQCIFQSKFLVFQSASEETREAENASEARLSDAHQFSCCCGRMRDLVRCLGKLLKSP